MTRLVVIKNRLMPTPPTAVRPISLIIIMKSVLRPVANNELVRAGTNGTRKAGASSMRISSSEAAALKARNRQKK